MDQTPGVVAAGADAGAIERLRERIAFRLRRGVDAPLVAMRPVWVQRSWARVVQGG